VIRERLSQTGAATREILAQYRAVLAERNVALLLGAGFASEIGDWFNTVALISLAFRFGEGALGVGGMLAVRMLTRLLVQGPAGSLVDRVPGRQLLVLSQVVMALVATAFILLIAVPALWLLYLLVILLESAGCVARPAFMLALKHAAPEPHRAAANGALFASHTTAQLVGPLLGALVLAPLGAAAVFVLNGLTFLGVAAVVGGLRSGPGDAPAEPVPGHEAAGGSGETTAAAPVAPVGYRSLLQRQDLGLYALASLSLALLTQATIALFVVRANVLGLGDGGVGIFFAAVAAGSLVGSVVAGGRTPHATPLYPAAVAMVVCALALAGFGVADAAVLAILALVVTGFATDFYEVVGLTYFQHAIPDSAYGRFFSLFLLALSAGGLAGALAGPVLERELGVSASLAALAAPGVALALLLAWWSRGWVAREREGAAA
jgi:MFS family permease